MKVSDFIAKKLSKYCDCAFIGQGSSILHIPDSLNKKLASENMVKTFSRSVVSFGTEIVSSLDTKVLKTREQVRSAPLAQNITQIGDGVGFQLIGQTNLIA